MVSTTVLIGLVASVFVAIIGVYVWTFKVYKDLKVETGKVWKAINDHFQNSSIHAEDTYMKQIQSDDIGFVRQEVCNALHKSLSDKVDDVHGDVKLLLKKVLSDSDN